MAEVKRKWGPPKELLFRLGGSGRPRSSPVLLNQGEFGTYCTVDKHIKISVEICIFQR